MNIFESRFFWGSLRLLQLLFTILVLAFTTYGTSSPSSSNALLLPNPSQSYKDTDTNTTNSHKLVERVLELRRPILPWPAPLHLPHHTFGINLPSHHPRLLHRNSLLLPRIDSMHGGFDGFLVGGGFNFDGQVYQR